MMITIFEEKPRLNADAGKYSWDKKAKRQYKAALELKFNSNKDKRSMRQAGPL